MTKRWPVIGLSFGVLWVFVRGVELTADAVLGQLLLGTAVGMPVAYVFRRLYDDRIDLRRMVRTLPALVLFVLSFVREVIVANVDVAYRVLAPSAPIEPQVILVPLRVETDFGIATIANSITITPGTITLDHDPEENALYVHVIDGRDPEAIVEPIHEWENYVLVFLDEPGSPNDPAPEIRIHPPEMDLPPAPRPAEVEREAAVDAPGEPRDRDESEDLNESGDRDDSRDDGGDRDGR